MERTFHGPLIQIPDTIDDRLVAEHLKFAPDAGHIRLFDQRMLLMHGFSMAALRHELVERLGHDKTREIFTRMGYQQGVEDARNLREKGSGDLSQLFAQAPRLREIEGYIRNKAVDRMQFNSETGEFWGDYYWQASWEAEAHLKHFGISGSPACWMMVGYASGCSTTIMGRPILWRELECVAMGHPRCRVVGQPVEECAGADEELRFLQVEEFVAAPRGRAQHPVAMPIAIAGAAAESELPDLIGASAAFNAVIHKLKRVAATNATVLLQGESGVGKERFSKTLHAIGPRSQKPFISVNCAAIPQDLIESELFGVERGAYTGAVSSRPGRFERADGGTLFLDEISSLPLHSQGKLLRVLQEREVERLGDTQTRKVDVRIVAAANRDLRAEVKAGRFREDLFFRLNIFPVEIPPLRDRREDIPLMVSTFVKRFSDRFGKVISGITNRASAALWAYDWPGNVRELENVIERGVILADDGGNLDVQHIFSGGEQLPDTFFKVSGLQDSRASEDPGAAAGVPDKQVRADLAALLKTVGSLDEIESQFLDYALDRSNGNLAAAARLLKLRRGQVEYRLKKRAARPK